MEQRDELNINEKTEKKEYVKPECITHQPLDHVGSTYVYYTYTYVI